MKTWAQVAAEAKANQAKNRAAAPTHEGGSLNSQTITTADDRPAKDHISVSGSELDAGVWISWVDGPQPKTSGSEDKSSVEAPVVVASKGGDGGKSGEEEEEEEENDEEEEENDEEEEEKEEEENEEEDEKKAAVEVAPAAATTTAITPPSGEERGPGRLWPLPHPGSIPLYRARSSRVDGVTIHVEPDQPGGAPHPSGWSAEERFAAVEMSAYFDESARRRRR